MRRSSCPSQLKLSNLSRDSSTWGDKKSKMSIQAEPLAQSSEDIIIKRMPMFGFLSIPDALVKQFRIPSGCNITPESIALRKVRQANETRFLQPDCFC